jgi:hypothetical protein
VFRLLEKGEALPKRVAIHARVDPAAGEYFDADIAVEGHHFAVTGNLLHKMFASRMIQELEELAEDEEEEDEEAIAAGTARRLEQVETLALQYSLPSSRTWLVAMDMSSQQELPTRLPMRAWQKNAYLTDGGNNNNNNGGKPPLWQLEDEVAGWTDGTSGENSRRSSSTSAVLPEDVCQLPVKTAVLFLASLQTAQGAFGPDDRIDRLAGVLPREVDEQMAALEVRRLDVMYTALAVAVLEQRFPGQANTCQMIVDKARRWLVKTMDDKAAELLEAAGKLVKNHLDRDV